MAKNSICHVEFESTDLARSQAFYEKMFEWTFRSFGDTMVVFGLGDTHLGGLQKAETVTPGRSPSVWVEVDDVDAYLGRVESSGGSIKGGKSLIEGVGWSAEILDPDGSSIGLVQFER